MPTAAFYTLGCKVNQYESFSLMDAFSAAGFTVVEPGEGADVYIVNSCTVTASGDKKSLQAVRRFRSQAPQAVVVLCGCFPQAFPEKAQLTLEADIVMGSKNRSALLGAVLDKLSGKEGRLVDIPSHEQGEQFEKMHALPISNRTRAFLKIQDGCERSCTYCIIPTARGPVRSKPLADIREELESLSGAGYKEAVLAGVNLSCYGQDMGLTLSDAIETAAQAKGISRIRLGSLEPDLITDEDIARWALLREGSPGQAMLCPHFHLSLQSCCDETLRRMNRRYTAADYRKTVEKLRSTFPGCAITTDIMTGFPGETQAEHDASVAFVREIGFARAHVFTYSARAGTPAADMPDQVSRKVAAARAREMTDVAGQGRLAFLRSRCLEGVTYPVLFESVDADGVYFGHTPCYTPVWVRALAARDLCGEIVAVRLTGVFEDGCLGEI